MQPGKTRTVMFTERVELLPIEDGPAAPSPERLAAFQKKFDIKDKDFALQLIYALEATEPGDDQVSDLEQLAKSISSTGHEEHKLSVLFRLLDVERTGIISMSAVDQQLRKSLRENGFKLGAQELDECVRLVMEEFGDRHRDRTVITSESFQNALLGGERKHEDATKQQLKQLRFTVKKRASHASGLRQHTHLTLMSEELRDPIENARAMARIAENDILNRLREAEEREDDDGWEAAEQVQRAWRFVASRFWFFFWVFVWLILGIASIAFAVYTVIFLKPALLHATGWGGIGAFCGKFLLYWNCPLLMLLMCRNLWTWLRGTWFSRIFPVDSVHTYHKYVAFLVLIAALVHTSAHLWNFVKISKAPLPTVQAVLSHSHFKSTPSFVHLLFMTITGVTGIIILTSLVTMIGFSAFQKFRQKFYTTWWFLHHLFIPFYIGLLLHGINRWLTPIPLFWCFFLIPGLLYGFERLGREFKRKFYAPTKTAELQGAGVLHLVLKKPSGFSFRAGQYLYLNCKDLAPYEWHPFTITSSPLQDTVEMHIRNLGDWTAALHELVQRSTKDSTLGELRFAVDGGYGAPAEHAERHNIVMLVGAGIGITPFASIVRDLHTRRAGLLDNSSKLQQVYLFWLNREQEAFGWFAELLRRIEQEDEGELFKFQTYLTGAYSKHDIRNFWLKRCLDGYYHRHRHDALTKLRSLTHWGRPSWPTIFKIVAETHPNARVGVFFCGPALLGKELKEQCERNSLSIGTSFVFHRENFGL